MSSELFYSGIYLSVLSYIEDEKTEIMLSNVTKVSYALYRRYKDDKKKQLIVSVRKSLQDIGTLDNLICYVLTRSYLVYEWHTTIEGNKYTSEILGLLKDSSPIHDYLASINADISYKRVGIDILINHIMSHYIYIDTITKLNEMYSRNMVNLLIKFKEEPNISTLNAILDQDNILNIKVELLYYISRDIRYSQDLIDACILYIVNKGDAMVNYMINVNNEDLHCIRIILQNISARCLISILPRLENINLKDILSSSLVFTLKEDTFKMLEERGIITTSLLLKAIITRDLYEVNSLYIAERYIKCIKILDRYVKRSDSAYIPSYTERTYNSLTSYNIKIIELLLSSGISYNIESGTFKGLLHMYYIDSSGISYNIESKTFKGLLHMYYIDICKKYPSPKWYTTMEISKLRSLDIDTLIL